ncbi:hypothetical protein [Oceanipulchritudo coccoides]|uniref:hypothetical protein n=1 Tax=Oceanipulchritudo coccoides TaxID=2706888 RepID=UPI0013D5B794|nr:hypothetical protein [Oceanipulchritudo coccoides]
MTTRAQSFPCTHLHFLRKLRWARPTFSKLRFARNWSVPSKLAERSGATIFAFFPEHRPSLKSLEELGLRR